MGKTEDMFWVEEAGELHSRFYAKSPNIFQRAGPFSHRNYSDERMVDGEKKGPVKEDLRNHVNKSCLYPLNNGMWLRDF